MSIYPWIITSLPNCLTVMSFTGMQFSIKSAPCPWQIGTPSSPPRILGAKKKKIFSTIPADRADAITRLPPSIRRLVIPNSPKRSMSISRSIRPSLTGDSIIFAPSCLILPFFSSMTFLTRNNNIVVLIVTSRQRITDALAGPSLISLSTALARRCWQSCSTKI